MYIRVKTSNEAKTTYVQIVQAIRKGEKVSQRIVRHVGVARSKDDLEKLKMLAASMKVALEAGDQQFLFKPEEITSLGPKDRQYDDEDYKVDLKDLVEEQRLVAGFHDVYGKLFDDMGYSKAIANPARNRLVARILKDITVARIANPASKRASVLKLEEDFGITIDLDKVYRMMDRLDSRVIDKIKKTAYENTLSLLGGKINVIFYDATTLYFESFTGDELRVCGYGKDGKNNQPQVLLALMVTSEGHPIDYEVFSGSTYEGHTLEDALSKIRDKYELSSVVFVADSAMLSENNLARLEKLKDRISYIVGARIKNLNEDMKAKILDSKNYSQIEPGFSVATFEYNGKRLIVSYSDRRAAKDGHDRDKAIEKLSKKIAKSKSTKSHISNSGYRKYLKIQGTSNIVIDQEKIKTDSIWDGLSGVITNSSLGEIDVLSKYSDLWTVEAAFRVTKHDLAVRPIFHWKPQRVRAHIAICFIAYSLVKNLEYRVKLQYKALSIETIRQTLLRVQTSILFDRKKRIRYGLPSKMKQDAKKIYKLMGISRRITPYIIEKCKK
jgi:transposase